MKTNKLLFLLSFFTISLGISSQTVITVQGEAFTSHSNGSTATTTSGYRGTGYATVTNVSNYLEWNNVTASTAGYYSLRFRYRNNSAAFTSSLSVNGGTAVSLSFAITTVWSNSIESTVYLAAGANTIRLSNINNHTSSLIDELTLTEMHVVNGEDFSSSLNGSTATTTTGYNGTGYALMANTADNYLEWSNLTVNASQGAFAAIQFRYISTSTTAQNCAISVNGVVFQNYNFTQATSWSNSKVITVYLPAGANTLRLTANNTSNNVSPLIDEIRLTELSGPVYQAENATFANQPESSNWAGYTGSGFIKVGAANNDYLEFNNVYAPTATTATLKIRYTADTNGGRPCDLYVNNTFIQSLFTVRAYWNAWADQTTQSINLNAGMNTIKFVVNNTVINGPNIDQFECVVTKAAVSENKNISELTFSASTQIEVAAGATLTLDNSPAQSVSSIILAPTAKLSMGSNTITATNGILLQSNASGTATLTGDNAISNATVQQYVTAGRNWYVSPSVTSAAYSTLNRGKSGVDGIVEWDEENKEWDNVTTGTLVAGKGYIQVASGTSPGTTGTLSFTGTTNAGVITTPALTRTGTVLTSGYNLVGNPYPSYLRWSGTQNNSVKEDSRNNGVGSSFWYRTKRTGDDAYIFVTHNGASGYTIPSGTANTTITGVIPPMQAFWVRVNNGTASTTMTFTNDMRLHADNADNRFKAPRDDNRTRLRLQLANGVNTDEALIYFDAAAANAFDDYDSPKMLNNSSMLPDLYTKADDEKLVINGLNDVSDNMVLPLGYNAGAEGRLTLKVSEMSNFDSNTRVYLRDGETETELVQGTEYSFNTAKTSANESRFSLLFRTPSTPSALNSIENSNSQVYVNAANQLVIFAPEKSNYAVFNTLGQQIATGKTTSNYQISNIKLKNGVYVVKVNNESIRVIVK